MVCPKCGKRDNKSNICAKCGFKIDTPIKIKTFDDEEMTIDAPIITESHTFIDEAHFQEALKERLIVEQEQDKKKSNKKIAIYISSALAVIVLLIGLIYLPNSMNKNDVAYKKVAEDSNEFSSNNWSNEEFKLNGIKFKLKNQYMTFVEKSWKVDLEKYGYANGYILNSGDKTSTTIQLNNQEYQSALVQVGFINNSKEAKDIKDCDIWSISINNKNVATPVPFELPGGIKNGSTKEEIFKSYGELKEEKIYRSDSQGYTTYHYQDGYNKYLDLYVYDDEGLLEINFKSY